MTELVQRHMESMTEEIEEMRRTKLFNMAETRAILKKRKHYEYKINGVTKNLQDFKDYIQYEKVILHDIKVRRNKNRIADRKNSIDYRILKRIKYLYEIASQRFSNDCSLCLAYFKFCKESNYNQAASLVVQKMIKTFSHNPEVWQVAAAWHFRRDINQALNIIHKGLTIHKDCQALYSEAIRFELLNREKDDWSKDKMLQSNDELCCKKIETYIQSVFKNIDDFHFLLVVLKLLEPHDFLESVQNLIIRKLLDSYSNEELVWHTLAQREKNGRHYESNKNKAKQPNYCLNMCLKKYQEGLIKISETKRPALWTLYLDCLVEMQQQNDSFSKVDNAILIAALEEANRQIQLNEKYFIVWAKLSDEADVLGVLEKGLTALPESVELWKIRLNYAVMKDQVLEVNQVFKKAILNLKEKAAPVWLMALRYHTLTSNNEVINSIYKDGVKQPKEVSNILKPEYVQWLSLFKGIQEARKTYNVLAGEKPYCRELHATMAKIESLEMEQDVDELENVHKLACNQFGKEEVDIWINYIEFYLENHKTFEIKNPVFDLNDKILQIYNEADRALRDSDDGLLLSELKEKFDLIRNSVDVL